LAPMNLLGCCMSMLRHRLTETDSPGTVQPDEVQSECAVLAQPGSERFDFMAIDSMLRIVGPHPRFGFIRVAHHGQTFFDRGSGQKVLNSLPCDSVFLTIDVQLALFLQPGERTTFPIPRVQRDDTKSCQQGCDQSENNQQQARHSGCVSSRFVRILPRFDFELFKGDFLFWHKFGP
jgi:hypothetical protein